MLSRFKTGPLVRTICIEGWAEAHGGPQTTAATSRLMASRAMAAGHCMAETQPKQLEECCRITLLKTQEVKAAASAGGQCDDELAVAQHRVIGHGSPLDRRREAAGLFQPKAGRRIRPGNTHLLIGGRDDLQRRHWSNGDTGGELGSVVGAVGRGCSDAVADRDQPRQGSHETCIADRKSTRLNSS